MRTLKRRLHMWLMLAIYGMLAFSSLLVSNRIRCVRAVPLRYRAEAARSTWGGRFDRITRFKASGSFGCSLLCLSSSLLWGPCVICDRLKTKLLPPLWGRCRVACGIDKQCLHVYSVDALSSRGKNIFIFFVPWETITDSLRWFPF